MNVKQNKVIMIGVGILVVIGIVYFAHTLMKKDKIMKRRRAVRKAKKYAIKRRARMGRNMNRSGMGMKCNKNVNRAYVVSPIMGL